MSCPAHLVAPRRRLGIAASLLAVVACAPEPVAPSGPVLIGAWGSADAELIAIRVGAEVRLGCATISIEHPIQLSAGNTFAARGRLDGSGLELGRLPLVDVTGSLHDSQVSITAPSFAGDDPATYVLEAGVTRPPGELPVCPQ